MNVAFNSIKTGIIRGLVLIYQLVTLFIMQRFDIIRIWYVKVRFVIQEVNPRDTYYLTYELMAVN
jgi:hypothetical protein